MAVDESVCVIIFLKGETVTYERLEVDDAFAHIVDGGEIILVAVHHRSDQAQFVFAQVKHAKGWVFGKDSHDHDVATLLDGLHQRAYRNLYASHFKAYLITFFAEEFLGSCLEGLLGDVERMLDATLAGFVQTQVAHVGDQYVLGATGDTELGDEVADGSSTAHHYILAFHLGAVAGMGAYGGRFYHGSIVEAHPFGQLGYAVIVYDEEVLGCAVSLECLYTQMFADIILSAFTGVALAADQLWAGGDVVTGAAYGYLAAYGHYHSRVLMSLYHWIECGGVETVVRVYLTAADADALDVDEHLMGCQVSCLGFCYFLKLDTLGFYQYCLSHSCIVFYSCYR